MYINKNKINENVIYYLLLITPIIDLINGCFYYILKASVLPGQSIRMLIFILLMYLYIKQDYKNFFFILLAVVLFCIQEYVIIYTENIDIKKDILFISKIWYNMIVLLISRKYLIKYNINIKRLINAIVVGGKIIASVILVSKFFDIGVNSYNDVGYKGLFMGLNDITAVLIMVLPFVLYSLFYEEKKIKNIITFFLVIISLVLVGTKTGIVFGGFIIMYYSFFGIKGKSKVIKRIIILLLLILMIFTFKKYFWQIYADTILKRQKYFFSKMNFMSYLLSGRDELLTIAFNYWNKKWYYLLLGVGFTQGDAWINSFIPGHGMIEMDLLDILYFYGFSLFIFFICILGPMFFKAVINFIKNKSMFTKTLTLSFIIGFIISFLGGHVILSPLAGPYFMIIYSILFDNLRRKDYEKDNMYYRSQ